MTVVARRFRQARDRTEILIYRGENCATDCLKVHKRMQFGKSKSAAIEKFPSDFTLATVPHTSIRASYLSRLGCHTVSLKKGHDVDIQLVSSSTTYILSIRLEFQCYLNRLSMIIHDYYNGSIKKLYTFKQIV